jgi:hypothetical protein
MNTDHSVKPTFIGIGGHKCASTWLSECLRYHPEVFMSSPKEIHYFSYNSNHNLEWYLDHFKDGRTYKARGEFSATYLQYPEVALNIRRSVGEVKIIASLRDPVDRFVSHYKHLYRLGEVSHERLDLASFKKVVSSHPELLVRGVYSGYIREFFDTFGKENVFVLLKEDIDDHPRDTVRRLYQYLSVDPDYIPPILNKKVSPGIVPKIYALELLRVSMYRVLKKTSPSMLNLIRKTRVAELYRKLNGKKNSLKVTSEIRKELQSYYEEDIDELESLIGRDLSYWRRYSAESSKMAR